MGFNWHILRDHRAINEEERIAVATILEESKLIADGKSQKKFIEGFEHAMRSMNIPPSKTTLFNLYSHGMHEAEQGFRRYYNASKKEDYFSCQLLVDLFSEAR